MKIVYLILAAFGAIALVLLFPDLTSNWNSFANMTVHSVTANITSYTASNSTVVDGMPDIQDALGSNLWLIGVAILVAGLISGLFKSWNRNENEE